MKVTLAASTSPSHAVSLSYLTCPGTVRVVVARIEGEAHRNSTEVCRALLSRLVRLALWGCGEVGTDCGVDVAA